eukprot:g1112.t1
MASETNRIDGLKKDLRASHFSIGYSQQQNDWTTTSSLPDPVKLGFKANKFSVEQKKDLRAVHFVLGNYEDPNIFKSSAKRAFINFDKSSVERKNEERGEIIDNRKSNVKLTMEGNPTSSSWISNSAAEYKAKPVDADTLQMERVRAKEAKKGLQKTSVVLGYVPNDYETTNLLERPDDNVNYRSELIAKDLRSTNWKTGDDVVSYKSEYAVACENVPTCKPLSSRIGIGRTVLPPHKRVKSKDPAVNDPHRNCSIQLGSNGSMNYVSSASAAFVPHRLTEDRAKEAEKVRQQKVELQTSSVRLGIDNTSYERESSKLYDPGQVPASASDLRAFAFDETRLRKAHFRFGYDRPEYVSEASARLCGPSRDDELSASRSQHDRHKAKRLLEELRKSNIRLGNDSSSKQSEANERFKSPPKTSYDLFSKHGAEKFKAAETVNHDHKHIERELRKSNFELGKDKVSYTSVHAKDYDRKDADPAVSFRELKVQLQKTNYVLGYEPRDYSRTSIGHI